MEALLESLLVALPAVFFVVDPVGVVPIFLSMTAGDPPQKLRRMAARSCSTGAGLLLFFALFGGVVFKLFGVSLGAFRVAGGLLLLLTALDMLRARPAATRTSPEETREGQEKDDVAVVPLAMPLLAGPGAIATVMVLMSRGTALVSTVSVVLSILITFGASYLLLRAASGVQKVLGRSGVAVLERVMGLILAAIAVQFVADGWRALWNP